MSSIELGYKLSSEEHPSRVLVSNAQRAEQAGFQFALISDHYHPWTDRQGQSPFVWGVLGAIAARTQHLVVGTGVTCPTIRIHPAIIAQAAATAADLMPGRFFLGLGSGENLNEHVLGDAWPSADSRLSMLEEAIEVIRLLWKGGLQNHFGDHYVVENARIYTLPEQLPPIYLAASGDKAATLAGQLGDGFIGTSPEQELIGRFESAGGKGKPKYCEISVCWGDDEQKALQTTLEWWPNVAMSGQLGQDLALPSHYEAVAKLVREDDVADAVACGPDPKKHLEQINKFVDAGYDHICIHQIGPDQEGMISFYEDKILPELHTS
jgi:coenzyme F420-dependent glucose-6-phosphate dehydrogenase